MSHSEYNLHSWDLNGDTFFSQDPLFEDGVGRGTLTRVVETQVDKLHIRRAFRYYDSGARYRLDEARG